MYIDRTCFYTKPLYIELLGLLYIFFGYVPSTQIRAEAILMAIQRKRKRVRVESGVDAHPECY